MSASNPLMPQGSLPEPRPRNKSNVYIAVFAILAFHVVLLGALLLQGCKDKASSNLASNTDTNLLAIPTNPPPTTDMGVQNPFLAPSNTVEMPIPTPFPPVSNVVDVATPLPPPPAGGAVQEHVVAAGESFTTIGRKYGVTADAIAKANPGVDSRRLQINQKLKIPEKSATATTTVAAAPGMAAPANTVTYKVKKGDTLIKIAKAQGSSVEKIKSANNLRTTTIREGQTLKVPTKAEATAPTATPPPASAGYVTPLPGRATASL